MHSMPASKLMAVSKQQRGEDRRKTLKSNLLLKNP